MIATTPKRVFGRATRPETIARHKAERALREYNAPANHTACLLRLADRAAIYYNQTKDLQDLWVVIYDLSRALAELETVPVDHPEREALRIEAKRIAGTITPQVAN